MAPVSDGDDWFEDTAAEQLRQDQCLMADVLRLGGSAMAGIAQDGLNQPQDKLHELADRQHWEKTPLAEAFDKDREAATRKLEAIRALQAVWEKPLKGLETPGGFGDNEFHSPPGSWHDGKDDFHGQTGLSKWIADWYWKNESDFYEDPTPRADETTVKAVKDLGAPLYGKDPDPRLPEWDRQLAEHSAFEHMTDWSLEPTGADNARIFLASGGFPRTAPEPGSAEFRIAVEDMKTRFASCAWRDPVDPNRVLRTISDTAAAEWQQEIASQAKQRNQLLDMNDFATDSLADGAEALGALLGHSWVADHLARWQDYWSPGGVGWIGDSPVVIEVPGAKGKCLDVQGGGKKNGTPVQIYKCNGTAAQKWLIEADDRGLHLRNYNSYKCLDVSGGKADNGRKIQIWSCNQSPAQTWSFNVRATTPLKSVGTGKCLELPKFDNGYDARQWSCKSASSQRFRVKPTGHKGTDSLSYPDKGQFAKAKKGIPEAQAAAKAQLAALKKTAKYAKTAADTSASVERTAYGIADANGAPRGRGLLVGQQKAQVTRGAAAALEAMVKAGETAEAATRASAGDSATIMQRALAQAAQSKAEFRKEAARAAELQAKAAADAAKTHRDNAKKDKETAEAKLAQAMKAEADAKAAAAEARAKRLAAEAEEKTALKEKANADARKAEAARHRTTAEAEATKAKDAKAKAESAEATAVEKKNAAKAAREKARDLRDDAWDAEQKANAARARADAKEAYAQAHESDANAKEARAAADEADRHASDAEAAAGRARTAANAATKAATDADAAATRAEAAAKRARAAADAAQAAKLKADAAVKTATSAAAEAIQAAKDAAAEAKAAVKLADEAEAKAKTAKSHADAANKETARAQAAAAKAAGYAHVTALAAVDAGNAASQVAKPANDAIQLGSPYVTTDSAAGLVVLTGQSSKSIADRQKAVADAHAKNAQEEAAAAKALAEAAKGDTKAAYQHAANAAGHAARARTYAKEALGYSADAATAASRAAQSLARTIEHGREATADAAAADKAAGRAEGHAKAARASADGAALDAQAARTAAATAEQAAKEARAAATRADEAATAAEKAAKDAHKYAEEAQKAAEAAETAGKNSQIKAGATTGIGSVFYVVDRIETVGEPDIVKKENCNPIVHFGDCVITAVIHFTAVVDLYLCTEQDFPAAQYGCPSSATVFLGRETLKNQSSTVTRTLSMLEFNEGIDPVKILLGDFIECAQKIAPGGEPGSLTGCAWAAVWFVPTKAFKAAADGIRALDAAMRTGIGIADAARALKALELDPRAMVAIQREADAAEAMFTTCTRNSFPAGTRVLMADGTRRPISLLQVGDQVMAADPDAGVLRAAPVTDTFQHSTDELLTISLADGSSLETTPGHKIRADGRGWILASELRPGDRLLGPDGSLHNVTEVRGRWGMAPQQVHDLTVGDLHTFYVSTGGSRAADVLVHNCLNLRDEQLPNLRDYADEIHTLKEHVNPDALRAFQLAEKKGKVNTVWTSEAIAQQAVDRVVSDFFYVSNKHGQKVLDQKKWTSFQKWLSKARDGEQYPVTITGKWNEYPSLGKAYHPDGVTMTNAGNEVVVILMKVKKHTGQGRGGYVVKTAYPK
ncbi:ricin-type beta-trefoil lectin domain protein [Streptomyces sp. MUM 203J]|uniref:RICIN domain-containing protein n=1 Tax=Streptomyces sp. MUM 203J TaxID=2791990 RepID=UPI001F0480F6|nr:ricin-type beta-trefoil lectin domain protein [Streptomyces sp. MUM 203J]